MNSAEHYQEAQRLLYGPSAEVSNYEVVRMENIAAATAHAQLAAVALMVEAKDGFPKKGRPGVAQWQAALAWQHDGDEGDAWDRR